MPKADHNSLKSGNLLIAAANLVDPNFSRSVILLCEHIDPGSFGLVLNHPTDLSLKDLVSGLDVDAPIYKGGPVEENSLHFIHRCKSLDLESIEVVPGVFWGGDFEGLMDYVASGEVDLEDCRFFVGYSGWGPGQLREEVISDSWYITDATHQLVFIDDITNQWRQVLKSMGPGYKMLSTFPDDPRLN